MESQEKRNAGKGKTAPDLIEPPIRLPDIQRGVWCPLPAVDPLTTYVTKNLWGQPGQPVSWEVARLSGAVYLYRETATRWALVAKFYSEKTGVDSAERHAQREFENTLQAGQCGLSADNMCALKPLGLWRGVLLLEYIDGLTLEDVIAVRRSRPGTLLPGLALAAELLATLHVHGVQRGAQPDFDAPVSKAHKVVDTLVKHGVLADEPVTASGLRRQLDRWAAKPAMRAFTPTLNHGDATTANFVFPWGGGVVGIDWERFKIADPAADLGRLMAEVAHSIKQHGGSVSEAVPDVQHAVDSYRRLLPRGWDADALVERARFYRAASTLRIARNGWVSRLDRTALVAQALALLSDDR